MHKKILITIGITFLFLGLAIQPSVAVQPETEIDVEPKDYLFQTIIDIANNPEVKELFEQYKPDMFKVDIDRSVYRKIFFRNPRLLFDTLFTKPSISIEYLNKCYNNGIEITNILGEDKALEFIENVEVTDIWLFDEIDDIISKDKELSSRLETLKEMNKEQNSDSDIPPFCFSIFVLFLYTFAKHYVYEPILEFIYNSYPSISIFFHMIYFLIVLKSYIILISCITLWDVLDCELDLFPDVITFM